MIIYNVTVSVSEHRTEEWLEWMRGEHIPEVLNTGKFFEARFTKVMGMEDSGNTFSIQYRCASYDDLNAYQTEYAHELQQKHIQRFGDDALAFRTLLELIEELQAT